jgi:hypothetical protein
MINVWTKALKWAFSTDSANSAAELIDRVVHLKKAPLSTRRDAQSELHSINILVAVQNCIEIVMVARSE